MWYIPSPKSPRPHDLAKDNSEPFLGSCKSALWLQENHVSQDLCGSSLELFISRAYLLQKHGHKWTSKGVWLQWVTGFKKSVQGYVCVSWCCVKKNCLVIRLWYKQPIYSKISWVAAVVKEKLWALIYTSVCISAAAMWKRLELWISRFPSEDCVERVPQNMCGHKLTEQQH